MQVGSYVRVICRLTVWVLEQHTIETFNKLTVKLLHEDGRRADVGWEGRTLTLPINHLEPWFDVAT